MNEKPDDPLENESPAVQRACQYAYTFKRQGEQALRNMLTVMIAPPPAFFKAIEDDPAFDEQERKMLADPSSWIKREGLEAAAAELRKMNLHSVADIVEEVAPKAPRGDIELMQKVLSNPDRGERRGMMAYHWRQALREANRDPDGVIRQITNRDVFSPEVMTFLWANAPAEDVTFATGKLPPEELQ
jgi:hypothetical protein